MSGGKILLVDDKVDLTTILLKRLEVNGYEVEVANDGLEALEKVEAFEPDVMILDVAMPRMDGYEVCETLRKREKTKNLPIIMLTARAEDSDRLRGQEAGASKFIVKPFEAEELLADIKSVLDS